MAYPANLFELESDSTQPEDWTFATASTRELTHCYHDYPARMIPQVAGKLIDLYASPGATLFDPYCGSGTSLVEGMTRGANVIGTDLNPLACLISKAKTAVINLREVECLFFEFDKFCHQAKPVDVPTHINGITRLDFWFKPRVIEHLSVIKSFVDNVTSENAKLFFQTAFSETVRESSNTRNSEFKLYRYDAGKLQDFEPQVFDVMKAKLKRNLNGLQRFLARLNKLNRAPSATIYELDSATEQMFDCLDENSVDAVTTSPPYGDSHTTVAYGQYSRLSAAWLGLNAPATIDRRLMGGVSSKQTVELPCVMLNEAIQRIEARDAKRAREITTFYRDLYASISCVARLIKHGGHACYVTGNRTVKGTVLPTDEAIRCFFQVFGFTHINTFHRLIPNKRMPLRNSPTNAVGVVQDTMNREHIIIMRRL